MKRRVTASLPRPLSSSSAAFEEAKKKEKCSLRGLPPGGREAKCAEFAVCHFMSNRMSSERT